MQPTSAGSCGEECRCWAPQGPCILSMCGTFLLTKVPHVDFWQILALSHC